jgi:hypothetical protein
VEVATGVCAGLFIRKPRVAGDRLQKTSAQIPGGNAPVCHLLEEEKVERVEGIEPSFRFTLGNRTFFIS